MPSSSSFRESRRFSKTVSAMLCAFFFFICNAQVTAVDEVQIRAAMLFNLTKFVEWPVWKMGDLQTPFVICLLGNDPIGGEIETMVRDKRVQERQVTYRHLPSSGQGEGCHVLYIAGSERKNSSEVAAGLDRGAVLTVNDHSRSGEEAIISLPIVDNRVQIQVNLKAAQRSGLIVSSKLLRIASVTR